MKEQRRLPGETYSKDEINLILKNISKRSPTGIRNRALVAVLYGAGLRISEALDLMPNDINFSTGEVTVKNGKGNKFRIVGLPEQLISMVQLWIEKRKTLGFNGNRRLFCTHKGGPMSSAYIRGFFGRLGRKIEDRTENKIRIHPHGFRHSMATTLLNEGFNVLEIQDQLGHSNLGTTAKYLKRIAPQELVNKMYSRTGVL